MKTLKTIQTLSKLGKILSKIVFIFAVIGVCGCVAGMLSLNLGHGGLIKIGGVPLHGLLDEGYGYNIQSVTAALSGWLIVCAGKAVLAKFAECYFQNELAAGTPFTHAGAKELMRLGILTLAIPTGCAVAASIVQGIMVGIMQVTKAAELDLRFDNGPSIALGVMFLLMALLCRYGAEERRMES